MEQVTPSQYQQAWRDFQAGKISLKEWEAVAVKMWEQTMLENVDVLKRLADR